MGRSSISRLSFHRLPLSPLLLAVGPSPPSVRQIQLRPFCCLPISYLPPPLRPPLPPPLQVRYLFPLLSPSPPLQVRYPFLYANLEALTVADVRRLLVDYKELVLKYEATTQVRATVWL